MKTPASSTLAGPGVATLAAIATAAQTNQTSHYNQTQRTIRDYAGLKISAPFPLDLLQLQKKKIKPGPPDGISRPRTKEGAHYE